MYAIIRTGGKQYRVEQGDVLNVEKITLPKKNQKNIKIDQVLLVNDGKKTHIGSPYVKNAVVTLKLLENGKSEKVVIFKYKAKKDFRKKQGHRQPYSKVEVAKIEIKKPAAKKSEIEK